MFITSYFSCFFFKSLPRYLESDKTTCVERAAGPFTVKLYRLCHSVIAKRTHWGESNQTHTYTHKVLRQNFKLNCHPRAGLYTCWAYWEVGGVGGGSGWNEAEENINTESAFGVHGLRHAGLTTCNSKRKVADTFPRRIIKWLHSDFIIICCDYHNR